MNLIKGLFATLRLAAARSEAVPVESEMKEISYSDGLVKFEVPQVWLEEYEDDGGGMFYREGQDSGTLRVNVITASAPSTLPEDEDLEILRSTRGVRESGIMRLANGNAIAAHVEHCTEQGKQITLFWWHVTNIVPPKHFRIANFSYTVLTSKENSQITKAEVGMLGRSIENAQFHPEIGQLTN